MIEKTFSKTYTHVSKQQIWQLWADIDQWPRWNPGVVTCKLHGPFTVGSHFTLTPKNGPEVDIELVKVENLSQFIDCTRLPGAEIYGSHEMIETDEGVTLINKVTIRGEKEQDWWEKLGDKIADKLPTQTDALVELAKQQAVA